jgi:hypothetical protein
MSPELLHAVKERIEHGHPKAAIKAELEAAGYDAATIEAVVTAATPGGGESTTPLTAVPRPADETEPVPTVTLPGVGALVKEGLAVLRQRLDLFVVLLSAVFLANAPTLLPLDGARD